MSEFALNGTDYIELKNLLKVSGLCDNGAQAKALITEEKIKVDGQIETRKACKIRKGQVVEFQDKKILVVE